VDLVQNLRHPLQLGLYFGSYIQHLAQYENFAPDPCSSTATRPPSHASARAAQAGPSARPCPRLSSAWYASVTTLAPCALHRVLSSRCCCLGPHREPCVGVLEPLRHPHLPLGGAALARGFPLAKPRQLGAWRAACSLVLGCSLHDDTSSPGVLIPGLKHTGRLVRNPALRSLARVQPDMRETGPGVRTNDRLSGS
jgi:hypothetical protein